MMMTMMVKIMIVNRFKLHLYTFLYVLVCSECWYKCFIIKKSEQSVVAEAAAGSLGRPTEGSVTACGNRNIFTGLFSNILDDYCPTFIWPWS